MQLILGPEVCIVFFYSNFLYIFLFQSVFSEDNQAPSIRGSPVTSLNGDVPEIRLDGSKASSSEVRFLGFKLDSLPRRYSGVLVLNATFFSRTKQQHP